MTGAADDPGATDDSSATADGDERGAGPPTCPHCRATLYKRHCKYVCPQHGPIIDYSDPFR